MPFPHYAPPGITFRYNHMRILKDRGAEEFAKRFACQASSSITYFASSVGGSAGEHYMQCTDVPKHNYQIETPLIIIVRILGKMAKVLGVIIAFFATKTLAHGNLILIKAQNGVAQKLEGENGVLMRTGVPRGGTTVAGPSTPPFPLIKP